MMTAEQIRQVEAILASASPRLEGNGTAIDLPPEITRVLLQMVDAAREEDGVGISEAAKELGLTVQALSLLVEKGELELTRQSVAEYGRRGASVQRKALDDVFDKIAAEGAYW